MNCTKKTHVYKNPIQSIVHLLRCCWKQVRKIVHKHLKIINNINYNTKKEIFFIFRFSFVSDRFSIIWTKKSKRLFLREWGSAYQKSKLGKPLVVSVHAHNNARNISLLRASEARNKPGPLRNKPIQTCGCILVNAHLRTILRNMKIYEIL